ncbi:MAG TPA: hypothetical protein VK674_01340 [Candidatus Limnocylindria bacterium]|nr:hypothetical protein [Candidatus Limnocylindria bacterium]
MGEKFVFHTPDLAASFDPMAHVVNVPVLHEYAKTARPKDFRLPHLLGHGLIKVLPIATTHIMNTYIDRETTN